MSTTALARQASLSLALAGSQCEHRQSGDHCLHTMPFEQALEQQELGAKVLRFGARLADLRRRRQARS